MNEEKLITRLKILRNQKKIHQNCLEQINKDINKAVDDLNENE